MSGILDGVVVLDLTRFLSGPQATLLLAGMGAEVIKIDDPKGGDPSAFAPPFAGPQGVSMERQTPQDMGLAYLKRARGKRSTTLNLKSPEGLEVFLQLVRAADVVVENFSAGVTERLGIDYAAIKAVNPRIVYCSLTGFGSTGPDRRLKAYDPIVQAATGLMSITGDSKSPPTKTGSPMSDTIAGSFAAFGVVSALLHRERTGEGQAVDVSMVDCLFSLMFDEPLDCYRDLKLDYRQGNRIMRFSPFNSYRTSDGWVVAGAATPEDWASILRVIGREDLVADPRHMSLRWRLEHNEDMDQLVETWTAQRTTKEACTLMQAAKIPCETVRSIDEVMNWPHLRERDMFHKLWSPLANEFVAASGPGFPLKFSASPGSYDRPPPVPGQDTDEVLGRLAALKPERIEQLRSSGVI